MTILGKATVITGISIFTLSTLAWIIQGNWQWFAGGAAIFLGTLLTAAVISAETKPTSQRPSQRPQLTDRELQPPRQSYNPQQRDTQEFPTVQSTDNDWQPPSTPPPDEVDPFSRPATNPNQ